MSKQLVGCTMYVLFVFVHWIYKFLAYVRLIDYSQFMLSISVLRGIAIATCIDFFIACFVMFPAAHMCIVSRLKMRNSTIWLWRCWFLIAKILKKQLKKIHSVLSRSSLSSRYKHEFFRSGKEENVKNLGEKFGEKEGRMR
jgi:hypothetical protein